jgi:hypothetical protein
VPLAPFGGFGAEGAAPGPSAGETPLAPPHEASRAIQAAKKTHFKDRNAVRLLFPKRTQPRRISMQPSDFPFWGYLSLSQHQVFTLGAPPLSKGWPEERRKSTDQPTTSPEQRRADES